jgi:hypothetical protein
MRCLEKILWDIILLFLQLTTSSRPVSQASRLVPLNITASYHAPVQLKQIFRIDIGRSALKVLCFVCILSRESRVVAVQRCCILMVCFWNKFTGLSYLHAAGTYVAEAFGQI